MIEQFTFTDLRMGPATRVRQAKSTFYSQSKDWRTDSQPRDEPKPGSTGWAVAAPPPGFRLVGEMQRAAPQPPAAGHAARPERRAARR